MKNQDRLVDFTSVLEMLGGEEKYLKEIAEAAIISFDEFSKDYYNNLMSRNETDFRKAGHKIKPVAVMFGVNEVIDVYEEEKTQFNIAKSKPELEKSAKKMTDICDRVLIELRETIAEK